MKVVACVKIVPDEQDIIAKDDNTLSFSQNWKISEYDQNAIEVGAQIAESEGAELFALTLGGETVENSKLKKGILSRGVTELFSVCDEAASDADTYSSAQVLAAAIAKIGAVDLVICGEGSGDRYSQQVGNYLGYLLGYAVLNAVSSIALDSDRLKVGRALEGCIEVLELPLPAVLSVTSDVAKARIPGLKEIMAAGKKPSTVWSLADVGSEISEHTSIQSTLAPDSVEREMVIIEGDGDEQIKELAQYIKKSYVGGGG